MDPPAWSDDYYDRQKKQDRLDRIVDVPYFADSAHVLLIQLADLVAYLLRRYAEVSACICSEDYEGESERLGKWAQQIATMSEQASHRYPARSRCATAELFWSIAPDKLRTLR